MKKLPSEIKELQLAVNFIKEGRKVVAYSPALDISTVGNTEREAMKKFEEIVKMFFEDIVERGVVSDVLSGLGWKKKQNNINSEWVPPEAKSIKVNVPIPA